MPFLTNRGVSIHYESFGKGPALVMQHGLFRSGTDWIDYGCVDALKADRHVILLDSRGHGQEWSFKGRFGKANMAEERTRFAGGCAR
jgi:pimeloyl-ACP methyl ester carboxylesterase